MCTSDFPQEETIIETYKENYDDFYMVYDDTPPCSPHGDEGLKSSLPCNIFETIICKEDYCERGDALN